LITHVSDTRSGNRYADTGGAVAGDEDMDRQVDPPHVAGSTQANTGFAMFGAWPPKIGEALPPDGPRRGQLWQPANAAEEHMADALVRGDGREFFKVVSTAELFLPAFADQRNHTTMQRFVTALIFDLTFLLVFTSVKALVCFAGGVADAYTVTSYEELLQNWPDPLWRLAVNPGTPIDAYLPIEAVGPAADGRLAVPTLAEAMATAHQGAIGRQPGGNENHTRLDGGAPQGSAGHHLQR
jgi:hypothetical protein